MALNFAIELDAAHLLNARLLCLAPFCPPWVGQGLVKQPLSPGALASVARGKMLPPTSAIDFYPRALDSHLTPAQIDTFVSCAPHRAMPVWEPLQPLRASETSGHDAVDAVSRASIRAVKPRGAVLWTRSRGVVDHELRCRRTSDALLHREKSIKTFRCARPPLLSPRVNVKTSLAAEARLPPSRARAPRD